MAVVEHLREALFGPWRYENDGLSMRWDPDDAKEYALRWRDPSIGGVSSVWGANRLAFEALPLFPTVPTEAGLRTTGFRRQRFGISPDGNLTNQEVILPQWRNTLRTAARGGGARH